ncbi:hypothetical protein WJX79_004323 [Trebouxia sp. C0005]
MSRSAADATCPWAMLLEAGTKLQNSSPQVFHIYPNSPAHAARATAMSSLLVALSGVTFAVTSQQVRCVTFPDPSPGFKVTYVICQNNALLVFCWPLKLPDGSAFKLAAVISNLLCNVMGPFEGSQQVVNTMEAALSELEANAMAQQPEAFVGSPQACLFHRGAVVASHASTRVTQAVWSLCWGLSLFHRTSSHPPFAMLQDLQMPAASQCLAGCGIVELASTCLHTLCKRNGPMPLLRDSALSPSDTSTSHQDTGQCTGRSASPVSQRRQQHHSLAFEASTGRVRCESEPTDMSTYGAQSQEFCARASMLHESMKSICQHTLYGSSVQPPAPGRAAKANSSQQAGVLGQQGCDGARSLEGQPAIPAVPGVHPTKVTDMDSGDGQQAPAIKMTIGLRACQQQQPDDAVAKRITGWLGDHAAFACHT